MADTAMPPSFRRFGPAWPVAGLFLLAGLASLLVLDRQLPPELWWRALLDPDPARLDQLAAHYVLFPRFAVALLVGAALGLAGTILQQVLRNPLAEPATLGISAGAHLSLAVATLWVPEALALGREWVALAGAGLSAAALLALSWRKGLSPVTVILAGLVLSLYAGSVSGVMVLFNHDLLIGLFLWGAGFLDQQDWGMAAFLAPRLAVLAVAALLVLRPLTLLGLGEGGARSLGLSVVGARLAGLTIAVMLAALTVAAVGVVSFVGLAAPTIVGMAGARRLGQRMLWAPLCGAALLWATDSLVLMAPITYRELPTGAVTAVLGVPMLLWLLPRLRSTAPPVMTAAPPPPRASRPGIVLAGVALLLPLVLWAAVAFGPGPDGWSWSVGADFATLEPWRLPRALAALSGGAMLAVAGTVLQRMTGNPLAAPEILGVSSGAILGVIALMFSVEAPERGAQIAAGGAGAVAVLAAMLALGRKDGFSPDRLLLAGVATSSISGVVVAVLMAGQDPRLQTLVTWLSGSTYMVGWTDGLAALSLALLAGAAIPFIARWLDLLPLGGGVAAALGVSPSLSRIALFSLSAVLTAAATLIVGPLSFVGLMGPHLARMLGLQRAAAHLAGSAMLGGLVMLLADWLGRGVIFPYQVPAGLLASVIGGPFLLWLLGRR
ncbi:iron complex transport system permease protein [Azospirillum lipoferum]|uniref:Fe(3+)-hydroxamate ABC transporter permease FhuB n=1 Tax=Azospirillum lipoferum TaxID=193 RepID=A0A5A9GGI3_AZOLI|nr:MULTISPECIES: Fe(3+)-hydroxamate ABC transporter permease FhuB [Azospirillum]KAA0592804.1 Fe(3+)-hydroxamate ABC transporter permease FhuB [Azospirillum lipoferum]MCP1614236.1 iron complex transport system permease protein [Azospirillum lipoferum]MDW5531980.1 Fe(3+)-hydroxamate ABC transporter permease FhuB [Azospirillum sp. NL1]